MKHLNFFMVTIDMKAWWLQTVSVTPLVILSQAVLICFPIALPLGAAAMQGPTAAAISLGCGLVFWAMMLIYIFVYENW